jgi:hypothetical protein
VRAVSPNSSRKKPFDLGARARHVGVLTGRHVAHYLQDRCGDDRCTVLCETRAVVSGRKRHGDGNSRRIIQGSAVVYLEGIAM